MESANKYFDLLLDKLMYPEFLEHARYLIDTYGESILERLQKCKCEYAYMSPLYYHGIGLFR